MDAPSFEESNCQRHAIKYRLADIITQKIGWGTNTSHAECGQLSIDW